MISLHTVCIEVDVNLAIELPFRSLVQFEIEMTLVTRREIYNVRYEGRTQGKFVSRTCHSPLGANDFHLAFVP